MFFILLVNVGCALPPASEIQCGFALNSYHQRVSWKGQQISVTVDNSFYPEYEQATKNAINTWNQAIGRQVLVYQGKSNNPKIYFVPNWTAAKNIEGWTTILWNDTIIKDYSIQINNNNFFFSVVYYWNGVDLESLILHELGHVLGLVHVPDETPSVMNQYLAVAQVRRTLYEIDIKNVRCEY